VSLNGGVLNKRRRRLQVQGSKVQGSKVQELRDLGIQELRDSISDCRFWISDFKIKRKRKK
jgi:hypothetical protein